MDEIAEQIAKQTNVDPATVAQALTVIVSFLAREAPADKLDAMIDKLPGARAAIKPGGSGGLFGVFNELSATGLGMGQIQSVTRAFVAHAREKIGAREVDEVIRSIPGLGQFV